MLISPDILVRNYDVFLILFIQIIGIQTKEGENDGVRLKRIEALFERLLKYIAERRQAACLQGPVFKLLS